MIKSAEEFKYLRLNDDLDLQHRAGHEPASYQVWIDVIEQYPDLKKWVIYNKTIQIEILELLAGDPDPEVRFWVARKRKINDKIIEMFKKDTDVSVRASLLTNTKLPIEKKMMVYVDDKEWLRDLLEEQIRKANKHKK